MRIVFQNHWFNGAHGWSVSGVPCTGLCRWTDCLLLLRCLPPVTAVSGSAPSEKLQPQQVSLGASRCSRWSQWLLRSVGTVHGPDTALRLAWMSGHQVLFVTLSLCLLVSNCLLQGCNVCFHCCYLFHNLQKQIIIFVKQFHWCNIYGQLFGCCWFHFQLVEWRTKYNYFVLHSTNWNWILAILFQLF